MQDIIIIGGGMVGAAAAVGLAQLGLNVAVVESTAPSPYSADAPFDLRVSAISVCSENLLDRLQAMDSIKSTRLAPYLGLETWELDGFITQFSAKELKVSHLGHIVENRLIQLALWQRMNELDNIQVICPGKVNQFTQANDSIIVELNNGQQLQTRLLIGADGANSQVRQWAQIGVTGWNYRQSAMLINIETQEPQQNVTWQQFTPSGPRAFLPLSGNHASLVWYDSPRRIDQLAALNNIQLAKQIDLHFPDRLARDFTVLSKGSFPLTRKHAQAYFTDNLVIIGDAAHTINPLAGQGVNLGFKDVEALIDVIAEAITDNQAWWQAATLMKYQQARSKDNLLMMSVMDAFYAGFSNNILPLKILRNIALKVANNSGIIKNQVLKYAMGLN